jgi:hypothetical protein
LSRIVEEGNNSSSSHSIFGDHRIVGTRQQHDMVVPDSSMVSPMSLKVSLDDENHENIGPQDQQVCLQQILSENEGQLAILSEGENKSEFGDSTKCEFECFHIQGMRVTPHKERGNDNMPCEDFCTTDSFISRFVSHFMQDSKMDPLQ